MPRGDELTLGFTDDVLLSVLAHGVTSSPLAARYGRHAAELHARRPEHPETADPRTRSLAGKRPTWK